MQLASLCVKFFTHNRSHDCDVTNDCVSYRSKVDKILDIITGNPTVIKMVIHYTRCPSSSSLSSSSSFSSYSFSVHLPPLLVLLLLFPFPRDKISNHCLDQN